MRRRRERERECEGVGAGCMEGKRSGQQNEIRETKQKQTETIIRRFLTTIFLFFFVFVLLLLKYLITVNCLNMVAHSGYEQKFIVNRLANESRKIEKKETKTNMVRKSENTQKGERLDIVRERT